MSKFNVGDHVRIVRIDPYEDDAPITEIDQSIIGQTGIVYSLDCYEPDLLIFAFDEPNELGITGIFLVGVNSIPVRESELELV